MNSLGIQSENLPLEKSKIKNRVSEKVNKIKMKSISRANAMLVILLFIIKHQVLLTRVFSVVINMNPLDPSMLPIWDLGAKELTQT